MKNSVKFPHRPYKRRTVLVEGPLQIKHALLTMGLVILACFMVWWETFRSVSTLADGGMFSATPLMGMLHQINLIILFKVILLLFIVCIFSIFISHYVAGPIRSLKQCLMAVENGDYSQRMRLRKNDELKQVGVIFNRAVESIEKKFVAAQRKILSVTKELEDLAAGSHGKNKTLLTNLANDLRDINTNLFPSQEK